MRHLLTAPASGRVMGVVFRDDQYLPVQGMYGSTWRADPATAGSGTLLEHSIHDVDMIEYLVGPVASISAHTAYFHGLAGIEDAVTASFTLAGGGVGSLVSVWHDVLERPSLRRVETLSERLWCALEGDWFGPVRWVRSGEAEQVLEGAALVAAVREQGLVVDNPDVDFVDAVAAGRPATPDFNTAVRAHELVDAAYRSAAAGGAPVAIAAVA
jgi:predicted dehydrogenase